MEYSHIVHPIAPLYNSDSKILILGSLPSVKSRESMFFYGHPQNRFWPVLASILEEETPVTIEQKRDMVLKHHIAMWDSIYSCDIMGSSDSSIRNVVPTDLSKIIENSKVSAIFCNGKTSWNYYHKFQEKLLNIEAQSLPSTSPANASWNMNRLITSWKIILDYL